jgi:putative glutamine amidotransferase
MSLHNPPIIGIAMDFELRERPAGKKETSLLYRSYYEAVRDAGGMPLLIPPMPAQDMIYLKSVLQGILLTGGDDLDPALYDEYPIQNLALVHPIRQAMDIGLVRFASEEKIPLLGICLGLQVINVERGGALIQDITSQWPGAVSQRGQGKTDYHEVEVSENSMLHQITRSKKLNVNTYHHQGIRRLGSGLIANAKTNDGLVEAVEDPSHPFLMGFQWHLEANRSEQPFNHTILQAFIHAAKQHSKKDIKISSNYSTS